MLERLKEHFYAHPALIATALGGAAAFGMAPHFAWYILIPAFAAFMLLVERAKSWGRAARIGWGFGVGHFTVGLFWIAHAFVYQDAMPLWVGWLAPIGLSLYLAIYPALCAALSWSVARKTGAGFAYIFAAFWIAAEMLRGVIMTGFPWNPMAAGFLAVADSVRWIGTYGLSGLVILLSGTVLMVIKRQWLAVAISAALIIGLTLLSRAFLAPATGPDQRLLIVQPNIGQQDKYREGYDEVNFERLARHTQPTDAARLIMWPEAAIPYVLETDEAARRKVVKLMGKRDVLLTGADSYKYNPDGSINEVHNSVVVMRADQSIVARYDKAHLVPGGEFLPLRSLLEPLGLQNLAPGGDFDVGPGPRTVSIKTDDGSSLRLGFLICYEVIFPGAVFYGDKRPDLIFNPSNDAWYGWWQPPQHLAMSQLRAMELGIPIIRSTPTGISSIIDADGKVVAALPMGKDGAIDAPLPPSRAATPFAQFGNLLSALFAAFLMMIGIALRPRTR